MAGGFGSLASPKKKHLTSLLVKDKDTRLHSSIQAIWLNRPSLCRSRTKEPQQSKKIPSTLLAKCTTLLKTFQKCEANMLYYCINYIYKHALYCENKLPLEILFGIASFSSKDRYMSTMLTLLEFSIKNFRKTDEMYTAFTAFVFTADEAPEVEIDSLKHHAR